MLSRFHLIPQRYGRTDRQTDRRTDGDEITISVSRVSVLTRDKNAFVVFLIKCVGAFVPPSAMRVRKNRSAIRIASYSIVCKVLLINKMHGR